MDALHLVTAHPLRSFDLRLELAVGRETLALAGPSGAGKSTVLRIVAGLLRPERGVVRCGGVAWLDTDAGICVPPDERSVGVVFQDYALFPHLTVAQNVAFGARTAVGPLLERFRISHLARVRPRSLSGGERQRVALARAVAREPAVLLLDEPMAALDAHTRATVRAELRGLLAELDLPALLVTHDFEDAAALATRVAVIVDGQVVQTGPPADLVAAPADPFVASFTGGNLVPGRARTTLAGLTEVALEDGTTVYSTDDAAGLVGVVVQPWEISVGLDEPADSALNHVRGPVTSLVPVGNRVRVHVGPFTAELTPASVERLGLAPGVVVVASFKATATRLVPLAP